MKKFKYVLVMFLAMTATVSCSDDSDDNANPILGTWVLSESEAGFEISLEATFSDNNKGTMLTTVSFGEASETENIPFTWSTDGNQLTLVMNGETEVSTYLIVGNKLTITDEEGFITVLTRQ